MQILKFTATFQSVFSENEPWQIWPTQSYSCCTWFHNIFSVISKQIDLPTISKASFLESCHGRKQCSLCVRGSFPGGVVSCLAPADYLSYIFAWLSATLSEVNTTERKYETTSTVPASHSTLRMLCGDSSTINVPVTNLYICCMALPFHLPFTHRQPIAYTLYLFNMWTCEMFNESGYQCRKPWLWLQSMMNVHIPAPTSWSWMDAAGGFPRMLTSAADCWRLVLALARATSSIYLQT